MTAAVNTKSPFTRAVNDLAALGYHALPIRANEKYPAELVAGRWRGLENWQKYRDRRLEPMERDFMMAWPGLNIGIVLGSRVGQYQLVAVDIDVEDYDDFNEIVAALPPSPMAKKGAKGITLFYRGDLALKTSNYATGSGKGRRMLCELLTGNSTRQTVVPPSIHPQGMAYKWERGPVHATDLPILDIDDVSALEETLEGIGWNAKTDEGGKPAKRYTSLDSQLDGPFAELNAAALDDLDTWVHDLDLFKFAQKSGARGYKAVATWRDSSSGRPDHLRKTNLHITPNGIRDFGADVGYSPLDLVMCARGSTFDDAFAWLSQKVTGEVNVIASGGLRAPEPEISAESANMDDEPIENVIDFDAIRRNAEAKAGEDDEPIADDEDEDDALPIFPDFEDDAGLTRWRDPAPSELVREIVYWITSTSTKPMPAFALVSALTVIATVIGRQYMTPLKGNTSLFALCLAPSGSGKNRPLKAAERLLDSCGLIDLQGPSQWTAASVLENELKTAPVALCIVDEYGDKLAKMTARNASQAEKSKLDSLKELFSTGYANYKTQSMALTKSQRIYAPHVSIFAAATPGKFFSTLTAEAIESGFFNRWLTVCEEPDLDETKKAQSEKAIFDMMIGEGSKVSQQDLPPVTISAALARLHMRRDDDVKKGRREIPYSARARVADMDPSPAFVAAEPEAARLYQDYMSFSTEQVAKDAEDAAVFYMRAAEIGLRIATILAVSECHDPELTGDGISISAAQMRWSLRFADWSTRRTLKEARQNMGLSEQARHQDEVVDYLARTKGKWTSQRKVIDFFRRKVHGGSRGVKEILQTLIDAGLVDIKQHSARQDGRGGRSTTLVRLIRKTRK